MPAIEYEAKSPDTVPVIACDPLMLLLVEVDRGC